MASDLIPGVNCTAPAILEFPTDLFTQEQRQEGAVLVHILASIYIFYVLAQVCDSYLVPAIEIVSERLNLSPDVAGASLMAFTTSAPELFTNFIGTFVTKGDIGVGTIVGSGVFNILGVCACCGFASKSALELDWYPLTRDCIAYLISVILFIVVIQNGMVFWYEAAVFIALYAVYMLIMWQNRRIRPAAEKFATCLGFRRSSSGETEPLLGSKTKPEKDPFHEENEGNLEDQEPAKIFSLPSGGLVAEILWFFALPARLVLALTIPDCRYKNLRNFYPLTLIMCSVHIGVLTYVMTWMMTIVGYTFSIPNSVMGLTFIAMGNSIPEVASSVIVARQGLGSMSISNSLGSNTFDILFCLGLPWLIRTLMMMNQAENYVQINSKSLRYSVIMLLASLLIFYVVLAANKFRLDKKVATSAGVLYLIFLIVAALLELNVFLQLNFPSCPI